MKGFELSNPREHFYRVGNIHLVLPSTPTLMVTLVLQLLLLVIQQLDGELCLPPGVLLNNVTILNVLIMSLSFNVTVIWTVTFQYR